MVVMELGAACWEARAKAAFAGIAAMAISNAMGGGAGGGSFGGMLGNALGGQNRGGNLL